MKMTRQEVAELLLNMNEDMSNVECLHSDGWKSPGAQTVSDMLHFIADNNDIYRIKDNSVKEVTPALLGRNAKHKVVDFTTTIITAVSYNQIHVHSGWLDLKEFNDNWQLVED